MQDHAASRRGYGFTGEAVEEICKNLLQMEKADMKGLLDVIEESLCAFAYWPVRIIIVPEKKYGCPSPQLQFHRETGRPFWCVVCFRKNGSGESSMDRDFLYQISQACVMLLAQPADDFDEFSPDMTFTDFQDIYADYGRLAERLASVIRQVVTL